MSVAITWGSTEAERAAAFPCDAWPEGEAEACWRAVDVEAPAALAFRWLCQLRAAPYSYDWIDNGGRTSPQQLTPGLDALEPGQPFMQIFRLTSFTPGQDFTLATATGGRGERLFGRTSVTYRVVPRSPERSRYLVKMRVQPPRGLHGRLLAAVLPWGDLVMMRRQLLNLKRLAERDAV